MATIRKKGKNHQAVIRRAGWPQQSKSFPTKKLAQAWARDIESKMDRGLFMDQSTAKSTTFDDLIERYLEEVTAKKRKPKPIEVDTFIIRRIQREERDLCTLTINKLKPRHFETYRDKRLQTPAPYKKREDGTSCTMAESTVVRELSLLCSIIQHRFIELGIPYNPASGKYVKRPAVNDKRDVRLSDEDMRRLIEACYKVRNNLIGPFVEMGFETGARRGEILSLCWKDVNLDIPSAMFRDVKNTRNPDNIKNRTIGLSTKAIKILQELPQNGDHVFPMCENAFKLSFKRIRKKLDMSYFHFHDTRHDFISRKVEAGMPITLIMAQVGHTSTRSLARYMTIKPSRLAAGLDKYG